MPGADTLAQSDHVHHNGFLNFGAPPTCKVLDIYKVVLLMVWIMPIDSNQALSLKFESVIIFLNSTLNYYCSGYGIWL